MKIFKFWWGLALLSILPILAGCSDIFSGDFSIRPAAIDLNGVTGFVVLDNSPAAKTKSETTTSTSQALYSLDANGNIKLSIFYFEIENYNGNDDANTTKVLKEISNALQIVPSLVTDFGKYIHFSGCQFQFIDTNISDTARSKCEEFINNNRGNEVAYLIRKSDGALFNLVEQYFFTYRYDIEKRDFPHYVPGSYIPQYTYYTSIKNNLFVLGNKPTVIYKIEDNGDAVDFRQMTQEFYVPDYQTMRFGIDTSENIYTLGDGDGYGREIHIYGANGGFNLHRFDSEMWCIDIKTDESGVPYIFLASGNSDFLSARLTNCSVEVLSETDFSGQFFNYKDHQYLGYYNDYYNWCDYSSILSYNKNTHQWSLRNLSDEILQILSASYDAIVYGSKTYCARLKGNSIEVIEIELASETYKTYSLNIDMNFIPTSFGGRMIQDVPYMIIEGRSPINGTKVTFTIDLISGVNNSTFAQDGRNVVSFFRIN